jgi:hypothetical protein
MRARKWDYEVNWYFQKWKARKNFFLLKRWNLASKNHAGKHCALETRL